MSETLNKTKAAKEKLSTKNVLTLFKSVIEQWKQGKHSEAVHSALAIIIGITTGKLGGLMKEVEKRKKEMQNEKQGPTEEVADSNIYDQQEVAEQEPDETPAKTNIEAFRKGELFASFAETFPHTEVEPKLVQLKTGIIRERSGAIGWKRNSTDDWDYAKAENTDKKMAQGIYSIEGILPPDGYTRQVKNRIPKKTAVKLTRIALALLKDPRMPLFKGIAMTVDGIEVMMIKEIHMHKRGTGTTYLCQPHTGVSYIVKK